MEYLKCGYSRKRLVLRQSFHFVIIFVEYLIPRVFISLGRYSGMNPLCLFDVVGFEKVLAFLKSLSVVHEGSFCLCLLSVICN